MIIDTGDTSAAAAGESRTDADHQPLPDIALDAVTGGASLSAPPPVTQDQGGGGQRFFNGYVTRFSAGR